MGDAKRFREQYKADKALIESKTLDALTAAVGYTFQFPLAIEIFTVAAERDAGDEWRHNSQWWDARQELDGVHLAAVRLLVEVAERFGLDGGPIYSSAMLCADLLQREPVKSRAGMSDAWPACLGATRWQLTAEEQRIITEGERVYMRLMAKCDIDREEPSSILRAIGQPEAEPPSVKSASQITATDPRRDDATVWQDAIEFARDNLTGDECDVLMMVAKREADMTAGLSVAPLSYEDLGASLGWCDPFGSWKSLRTRVNKKLELNKAGFRLGQRHNLPRIKPATAGDE